MHSYLYLCILYHMKSNIHQRKQLAASSRSKAVLQPRDFARLRIHPQEISRLVGKGELIRVGRGRYVLPQAELSENLGLALVAAAVPRSVICLLSALRFHGIGTQAPHEVWIAVAQGATRPRLDYPPVRVTLVSGSPFTYGIERHLVDGVPVRIYSPAKTVADCFRFRNKIGLNVAIEALREALRAKSCTREELWAAGKACRVTTVMRPYLEAI
jgi:predicted transcriptional regulator of viral defense system